MLVTTNVKTKPFNVTKHPSTELNRYKHLYNTMITAREAEERESILFRQGAGIFHLPGAGHEAIALLARNIKIGDKIFPHYRDKALMLALGVPLYQLALDYFGKAASSSGGAQMASHFFAPEFGVMPCATPTALQALPAAGTAWGMKIQNNKNISICIIGEASSRQGEWFEALAFAIQENLPLLLIVEDNGYGVSTPTENMIFPVLDMIPKSRLHHINSKNIEELDQLFLNIVNQIRTGSGVQVIWMKCPRLMSHTSSDDHRMYRSEEELKHLKKQDPLLVLENIILKSGNETSDDLSSLKEDIREEVRETYRRAALAENACSKAIASHTISPHYSTKRVILSDDKEWCMADAVNHTLTKLMEENQEIILFGEDISDPKGGVFGLTKSLSNRFYHRVHNSPLAEATIAGIASGMALQGFLPIFELQFIDFSGPALNQIMNQISTLRWRTAGKLNCPLVLIAPCGGYIAGGGAWHSQTNESIFSHIPGLRVYMPASPADAANALFHCVHGEDPALILLPKKQFYRYQKEKNTENFYSGNASVIQQGDDLTLIGWGNTIEICQNASDILKVQNINCEIVSLQSLSPLNMDKIHESVRKTGRVVVVQEDNMHCSLGQAVITELMLDTKTWDSLYAPPQLVSRANVNVPFDYKASLATLPDSQAVCDAVLKSVSH